MKLDPLPEQRERLLRAVAFAFLALMAVVAALNVSLWLRRPEAAGVYVLDLGLTALMAAAVMGVQLLARRDHYEAAAWLLVGALAARVIVTVGVVAPESVVVLAPGYLVVIVLAQVLIGARAGFVAILGAVPMYVFAYANLQQRPDVLAALPASILAGLFLYLTVGGFVTLALYYMEQGLGRARALLGQNERARRELQESEEQFRALAESSPTGIVIQQDGHLVYGNPRFAEMARCVRSDVFGLSLWDFFHPTGADALRARLASGGDANAGAHHPVQLLFKPLKGEPIWCEAAVAHAVYRDRDAIVANVLDVSDRVRAQQEVQRERDFTTNIINAADAIIMALDAEGNVTRLNPAGERITGYREEQLQGRPLWERLVPEEQRPQVQDLIAGVSAANRRGQLESVWLTKGGEERTIAWRWVAQTDASWEVTGIIAVGIDVTQQRVLERQAIAAERLRALGQMAGGVAHDLNNTLAGILGPVELMLMDEQEPERARELEAIAAAARRGAETVRRIQRFSQARTDLDRQVFNVRELAEEVVQTLRPRWRDEAQRRGVAISINNLVPDDLTVTGSVGEIGNVLTNLVVNACEAMPSGGEITITGSRVDGMVQFSVQDTGCGMSPETMEGIFQPFFTTKGAENSGLGLAVCRGIILRHGGNIDVSSEPGRGTTFSVTLPSGVRTVGAQQAAASAQAAGMFRCLVVDDTIPIADFAGAALTKMGHDTTVVYTSDDALEMLREQTFDLLLTDYGMEGLSGVNLAHEARRLHPHIKTIVMTGWDFADDEFEGVDASLSKPFTIGQLSEIIEGRLTT